LSRSWASALTVGTSASVSTVTLQKGKGKSGFVQRLVVNTPP